MTGFRHLPRSVRADILAASLRTVEAAAGTSPPGVPANSGQGVADVLADFERCVA